MSPPEEPSSLSVGRGNGGRGDRDRISVPGLTNGTFMTSPKSDPSLSPGNEPSKSELCIAPDGAGLTDSPGSVEGYTDRLQIENSDGEPSLGFGVAICDTVMGGTVEFGLEEDPKPPSELRLALHLA